MNSDNPLRKFGIGALVLIAAFPMACVNSAAALPLPLARQQSQSQSQQQQQPPPSPAPAQTSQPESQQTPPSAQSSSKQHKVWSNDDVIQIRTPADNYQMEKEAKEVADAKAVAKEAAIRTAIKSEKQLPLDIKLPPTVEETQNEIKNTEGEIQEETVIFDKMQKELLDTPAEQQARKQKEIDHLNGLIETSQRDLKALQDHLQTLRAKSQKETSPAALGPPPVSPTPPPPPHP